MTVDQWRDVMSYLVFTSEANLAVAHTDKQLLQINAATKRGNDLDISEPENENIHQLGTPDAAMKTATGTAEKAIPTPHAEKRTPLAPKNV